MAVIAVIVVALVVGIIIYTASSGDSTSSSRPSRRGRNSRNRRGANDAAFDTVGEEDNVQDLKREIENLKRDLQKEQDRAERLNNQVKQGGKATAREGDLQRQLTAQKNDAQRSKADLQTKATALDTCERQRADSENRKSLAEQETQRLRNDLQQCRSAAQLKGQQIPQATQPPVNNQNQGYQQPPGYGNAANQNQGYQQPNQNQGYQQAQAGAGQQQQYRNPQGGQQYDQQQQQQQQQKPPQDQYSQQQQQQNQYQQQQYRNQQQQQQQQPPQQQQNYQQQPPQGGQGGVNYQSQQQPPQQPPPQGQGDAVALNNWRQAEVKQEFQTTWMAYVNYAWGYDHLHPVSQTGSNSAGMAMTLVDTLDSLLIFGMDAEYQRAKQYVQTNLDFNQLRDISLFDTTIQVIGGLLSAYSIAGARDPSNGILLQKATEIADKVMYAFDTETGIPYGHLNIQEMKADNPGWSGGSSTVSEVLSIQLEFQYLSRLTNDNKYANAVNQATASALAAERPMGLFPQYINPRTGRFTSNIITMGARVDSAYETFLKQWLFSGRTNMPVRDVYYNTMRAMKDNLVQYSDKDRLMYLGELHNRKLRTSMELLVCLVPGMLALGSLEKDNVDAMEHLQLAESLATTCYEMHRRTGTGLAAEVYQFAQTEGEDFMVKPRDAMGKLRPETIESLFVLYRVTRNEKYRDWAWDLFESMRQYAKVPSGGYSTVDDVRDAGSVTQADRMENFVMSQTLKYLYLLFSPEELYPFSDYVYTTQAHTFPIR